MGMTNEEAIKIFKEVREEVIAKETELSRQVFENLGIKAIDVGIKALEQQPSEDCISRAQALHACCDEWNKDYKAIMKSIRQLPSVTPQPKIGKWIKPNTEPWIKMGEGFTPYECSECEAVEFKKSKYCPNCGAKMEVEG